MNQEEERWILCPACGAKTRLRLLPRLAGSVPLSSCGNRLLAGVRLTLAGRYWV